MEPDKVQLVLEALDRSRDLLDKTREKLDRIDQVQKRTEKSSRLLDRTTAALNRSMRALTATAGVLRTAITGAATGIAHLRTALSGLIGTAGRVLAPILALVSAMTALAQVKASVGIASAIEGLEVRFGFLFGNVQRAREETERLLRLTTSTPFSLKGLEVATRNIETLGKGILTVERGLKIASDVAVVTGRDIEFTSEKIGQLFEKIVKGNEIEAESLKGVLSAGDIQTLRDMRSAGADVATQIDFVIARLERFSGATARQQKTLEGLIGTTKSFVDLLRFQFGAPIRDFLRPIIDDLNTKMEALFDSGRVTRFGQTAAAVVGVVVDAFKTGTVGELLVLSIEAAIGESANIITSTMDRIFRVDAVLTVMRFSVRFAELLLKAVKVPVDFMSAGFTIILNRIEIGVEEVTNRLAHSLAAVINFLGNQLVRFLNAVIDKVNVIRVLFGSEDLLEPLTFDPVKVQERHAAQITFAQAFAAAQQESARAIQDTISYLEKQVVETEAVLRGTDGALRNEKELLSAKQQLIGKLEEQRAKIEQINAVNAEGVITNGETGQRKPSAFETAFTNFTDNLGNAATRAAQLMQGTLGAAINGVSAGITGLITGTATWGQVFAQVGTTIIGTLVQIGVEMLAQMVLRRIIGAQLKTQAATEGATIAGAYAPAAATAGAASFGVGTALGVTLTVAAIIAGIAALAGAFAEGGIVPGAPSSRDNRIAAVATGEGIIPASVTSALGPQRFEMIRSGRILRLFDGINPSGPLPRPVSTGGYAEGGIVGEGGISLPEAQVHVAVLKDRNELREYLQSRDGKVVLLDLARQIKTELGIKS